MIGGHPGGLSLTKRLLALGMGQNGKKILDLGAGNGESVKWLRQNGYEAFGIDLVSAEPLVKQQDMRRLEFPDESFELCLAECSVSGCGDGMAALGEAYRVLKTGGSFFLSDIFFHREHAPAFSFEQPLTRRNWEKNFEEAGFAIKRFEDETELWREFFLESLWNGNAEESCIDFFKKAGRYGCGYFLALLVKEGTENGSV